MNIPAPNPTFTIGHSNMDARWPSLFPLSPCVITHISGVSSKQIVQDLLGRIPDDASLTDITREIEFVAAVCKGFDELDRGEEIPIEQIERELPSWI